MGRLPVYLTFFGFFSLCCSQPEFWPFLGKLQSVFRTLFTKVGQSFKTFQEKMLLSRRLHRKQFKLESKVEILEERLQGLEGKVETVKQSQGTTLQHIVHIGMVLGIVYTCVHFSAPDFVTSQALNESRTCRGV